MRQLGGNAPDGGGGYARLARGALGSVGASQEALGQELEHGHRLAPVGKAEGAGHRGRDIALQATYECARCLVVHQRIAGGVAREQAIVGGARRADHQPRRVGVAHEVSEIDLPGGEQLVDQRGDEQAVGAGLDADPLVGNRAVAGAHRVDRDELDATLLELAERDLDRVGGVVLGDAEHQEVARAVPVGVAELPEGAAERVHAGRRHVDRAEAAVGREVGRAELHRPPSRERLALVAPGKERELFRVGFAHIAKPLGRKPQGLVPGDLAEVARAARADAQQRRLQARRRIVLHDAGRALAAQHALVHGVVAVALDVADLAVLEEHADAAAAGAHVAGGGLDLVGRRHRDIDLGLAHLREGLHQLAFLLPQPGRRRSSLRRCRPSPASFDRLRQGGASGMLVQAWRGRQHWHAPPDRLCSKMPALFSRQVRRRGAAAGPCRSPKPR